MKERSLASDTLKHNHSKTPEVHLIKERGRKRKGEREREEGKEGERGRGRGRKRKGEREREEGGREGGRKGDVHLINNSQ